MFNWYDSHKFISTASVARSFSHYTVEFCTSLKLRPKHECIQDPTRLDKADTARFVTPT